MRSRVLIEREWQKRRGIDENQSPGFAGWYGQSVKATRSDHFRLFRMFRRSQWIRTRHPVRRNLSNDMPLASAHTYMHRCWRAHTALGGEHCSIDRLCLRVLSRYFRKQSHLRARISRCVSRVQPCIRATLQPTNKQPPACWYVARSRRSRTHEK